MRSLISVLFLFVGSCFLFTGCKTETSLQEIVFQPNKTYKISKVYELGGKRVVIPNNCTLILSQKGKLCNGEIVGNNTVIKCANKSIGVKLKGTWYTNMISDHWFDDCYLSDDDIIANINSLQSDELNQLIIIDSKEKYHCGIIDGVVLRLTSNTTLRLNTTIQLQPNDLKQYSIIDIKDKHNVYVKGGSLIGDVKNHIMPVNGPAGEWGMGVNITNSTNIGIEDVIISHCWGDGIYVGGKAEKRLGDYHNASKNVTIKNVICDDNRRQGMSLIHVEGLTVKNCSFINTGYTKFTRPGAGVDIEPNIANGQNQSCKDLYFEDCLFAGNTGPALSEDNIKQVDDVKNVENVEFNHCVFSGLVGVCLPEMVFRLCELENLYFGVCESPINAVFEKCEIVSTNSQIHKQSSRSGYIGRISIRMCGCQIHFNDLDNWVKKKGWRLFEQLELEQCNIVLPQNEGFSTMVLTDEVKSIIRSSKIRFE